MPAKAGFFSRTARPAKDGAGWTMERASAAISALPAGIAVFDAHDGLVRCNDAFREVYESGDDPIPAGAKYAAILRGAAVKGRIADVRHDETQWVEERLREHAAPHGRSRLTLKTGRTYEVVHERLTDGGTVILQHDVTDYERREVASRTGGEKARAMLESVFDGVMTIGADGVIDSVNARAAEVFGRPVETIVGNGISSVIPNVPLKDLIGEAALGQVREVACRKGGATIDLEIAVNELPDSWSLPDRRREARRTFVATVRDITEKNAMTRQVQQAGRMNAIGTLAGGIAHDFNNILSIIMGYGSLLQDDLPRGSQSRENIDMVMQAARRARELVEQILTFSRRTDDSAKESFDPRAVVGEVLKLLRSTVPATIEIEHEVSADDGRLLGSVGQIHRVVMNLCTNAVQAIGTERGRLSVVLTSEALDRASASAWGVAPGAYWRLTVSDTGPGMEQAVLDRVFEPFFTTKDRAQGTGLGLAVVHGIVTDHGGVVRAESAPGAGSTFQVLLPLASPEESVRGDARSAAAPQGTGRILFVDDESLIVRMGQRILSRLGYTVVGATDSEEALDAFRAAPESFDLLITDQTMPGMTGDTLVREVRAIRPDLPVVLCTGYSQAIDAERAREMGIDAFVMKPLEGDELAHTVAQSLAKGGPGH